jgi:hypothetical protein
MTPPLPAALYYAHRMHWQPFPTKPRQKIPQIDKWPERATCDEGTIRRWWTETPDAGIGIATGAGSGLVVLDIDPDKGGEESLQALIERHGALPDTVEALTGGGGRHIFFAHPGRPIRNSAGKLGSGLDIRGDGGYVLVPPSIHPNGEYYRWEASSVPGRVSVAPLPEWLLRKLAEPEPEPLDRINGNAGVVPEGQRNAHLASLAGAMRRRGMTTESIEAALQTENAQRCSPPLDRDEVHAIAISISRYPPEAEAHPPTVIDLASAREEISRQVEEPQDAPTDTAEGTKSRSQATRLVELAADLELFNTDDKAYAAVPVAGHTEVWPLRSKHFRSYLKHRFYSVERRAPSAQATEDALGTLSGKAQFECSEQQIYRRVADHGDNIYIDLCDADWRVIKVTAHEWQDITKSPVWFTRAPGMQALPVPRHGRVDALWRFLNISDENARRLVIAWLLAALRPTGPYPVLVLQGEQGTGKSTFAAVLRSLIDPSAVPLRTIPRNEQDLMIAARNGWVIALDNLSGLAPWLSDALCRIGTGGGFATRELYSDTDEVLIDVQRPVILNGIDDIATRQDLIDRSIIINLDVIPADKRRPESEFWQSFDAVQPAILGGLLDMLSRAIRELPNIRLDKLPRMADFALWATAAEPQEDRGAFIKAYMDNRKAAIEAGLEGSPVATALQAMLNQHDSWTGTATDLLRDLTSHIDERAQGLRSWPKSAKGLSSQLRRLATALRSVGIELSFDTSPGTNGKRIIGIRKDTQKCVATVACVAPSTKSLKGQEKSCDAFATQMQHR